MQLAFYKGVRKMPIGLGNLAIQVRLDSEISHCELVFEPQDDLPHYSPNYQTPLSTLFPDRSLELKDGTLWCASSSATDKLPNWSLTRAGKSGGVRLKRISVQDQTKWILVPAPYLNPQEVYDSLKEIEGKKYDWRLIVGFLAWPFRNKSSRYTCHEALAYTMGLQDGHRLDPASLYKIALYLNQKHQEATQTQNTQYTMKGDPRELQIDSEHF